MAHLIDMSNGVANMAYTGEVPWHGLGFRVNADDPIDVWADKGGFTHTIEKAPVTGTLPDGSIIKVPNRWVMYRSDTKAPLAVMSSNFQTTQPMEVVEFFRELVTVGGFKMETLGMLRGGATYWGLARVDDSFDVGNGDEVLPYLLLATSCDGTLSNTAMFTTVRVVCNNTLSIAAGGRTARSTGEGYTSQIRIPHSTKFNAEKVKSELGLIGGNWDRFKKDSKEMSKYKMSPEEAVKFFMKTLYPDVTEFDPDTKRPLLELIVNTYETGVGQNTKSAKGTLWGAVNAITRVVDHERQAASNDSRLQSAWFGAGARQKQSAWNNALDLIAA